MCLPDKPLRFLKELLLSPSSMSARKHGDNITNLGKRQFQMFYILSILQFSHNGSCVSLNN